MKKMIYSVVFITAVNTLSTSDKNCSNEYSDVNKSKPSNPPVLSTFSNFSPETYGMNADDIILYEPEKVEQKYEGGEIPTLISEPIVSVRYIALLRVRTSIERPFCG